MESLTFDIGFEQMVKHHQERVKRSNKKAIPFKHDAIIEEREDYERRRVVALVKQHLACYLDDAHETWCYTLWGSIKTFLYANMGRVTAVLFQRKQ